MACFFNLYFRILTAREKRVRQKFNSDVELQAYEKRLKDIEKKIRQLVKRGTLYRLIILYKDLLLIEKC